MPRYIVKLTEDDKSWYMEWSTVVDAPRTFGMSLEEFKEYYKEEYGRSSLQELEDRLKRVEERGTSCMLDKSAEDTISWNRAGKDETNLSIKQIIDFYCKLPELKTDEEFKAYEETKPRGKKHG
jgi:hypothetical protein